MTDMLEILLTATFWAATLRIATPLIFGTLGELICERAGVLNLGIEGIMTIGAMSGWLFVRLGASLWLGVLLAALIGMAFGLLHALLTVPLGLSQHVTGIGITLLATSLAYFTYRMVLPEATSPPRIAPFEPLAIPLLSDLP
ncbi:MAG TPA: ABC transporter permease, partial [Geminicoccaceae bacterium]|nr:ABC transporter permease [Geminicoccaceae bacterium]